MTEAMKEAFDRAGEEADQLIEHLDSLVWKAGQAATRIREWPSVPRFPDLIDVMNWALPLLDKTPLDEAWLDKHLSQLSPEKGCRRWYLDGGKSGGVRVLQMEERFDVQAFSIATNATANIRSSNITAGKFWTMCRFVGIELREP